MRDERKKTLKLELIAGVEGQCVALNGYRIAGPKPWGGGTIVKEWVTDVDRLQRAVPELRQPPARVVWEHLIDLTAYGISPVEVRPLLKTVCAEIAMDAPVVPCGKKYKLQIAEVSE